MGDGFDGFKEIWFVDFEFTSAPGENPVPVCLVADGLISGRRLSIWEDDLRQLKTPPYDIGPESLVVAYYASAELGCHLALGWKMPANVLDLYVEFRNRTNGVEVPCGSGLLGALAYFGLPGVESVEKDAMRDLALRGGPWTTAERDALLAYCSTDVDASRRLFEVMRPALDLPRALLRSRYMAAVARIERTGIPIDVTTLARLRTHWNDIQDTVIQQVDTGFGVFDGRTFKTEWWERWLVEHEIPWPRLPSGALALDDDSFRDMAKSYPIITPIRELRVTLAKMRLEELAVGADGRNRTMLSAFRARSSRNQPSTTRFVFGPAVWVRGLIQPAPGRGLAYVDWSQQEFGIAAALSGDTNMQAAYASGDPYLEFAKQAGAVPANATKQSHAVVREQFKSCALGVQYGMEAESLARRIGQSVSAARELLSLHRQTYDKFWKWSGGAIDHAMLYGGLHTVFGWTIRTGRQVNPRSLRNFPMQANGAEMLRLACCLVTERGITVCAPIHDAILIEAQIDQLDQAVKDTQRAMAEASAVVLGGFRLRSDVYIVRHPDRYADVRGDRMWRVMWDALAKV